MYPPLCKERLPPRSRLLGDIGASLSLPSLVRVQPSLACVGGTLSMRATTSLTLCVKDAPWSTTRKTPGMTPGGPGTPPVPDLPMSPFGCDTLC